MKSRHKKENLFGLVLAGGASSRMGKDKSLMKYHGVPQKDFAFQILSKFCKEVFTSINKEAISKKFKNPIVDQHTVGGPLNGILSAMAHKPDVAWLTLPVDMPGVDESTIDLLIENRDKSKLATCFTSSEGYIEPLLTIWEPQAYFHLTQYVKNGKSSPNEFLKSYPVNYAELKTEHVLFNLNSPEDLDFWKARKNES